jgi:hypothetical protein
MLSFHPCHNEKKGSNQMSARGGDKARYGRLRKQKLARRVVNRALQAKVVEKKPEAPVPVAS